MNFKKETGDRGEDTAVKYLENLGYSVLDRNYRKPWGEIDVVMKKGGNIHFVEVKTVHVKTFSNLGFGDSSAEEKVTKEKMARMKRTIMTYLSEKRIPEDIDFQIDLGGVYINKDTDEQKINFWEDIFI